MKSIYIVSGIIVIGISVGLAIIFAKPHESNVQPLPNLFTSAEKYKEIVNPFGFVNIDGITIGELVGKKVILVDFLTYSCINCQRTFPYLNAWYEKYKDQGLEIIGIHTPEFSFEKDINNVRDAMTKFGIKYPIVLDNDYATWRAYGNQYWPRKYLIDIHGNIVYDHIGEGGYEETEMKIQELLNERAKVLQSGEVSTGGLVSTIMPEEKIFAQSPETYFGSSRNEYLGNGVKGVPGINNFVLPKNIYADTLYLGGLWNIAPESAESMNGQVIYKYSAKEVYVVAESDGLAQLEIIHDGISGTSRGADVDSSGIVKISNSRLYKIINNTEAGTHILEIKIKSGNARFYTFTFG